MVEAVTVVRSLHILFAVLWAGGAIHFQNVSKRSMEGSGHLLDFLANSKHGPFMGLTALATVSFGIATWSINGGDAYTTSANMILGMGALGGTIGLAVGFLGHLPNSMKAKAALASGDEASQAVVLRREKLLNYVSHAAIGVALLAMILFRWF